MRALLALCSALLSSIPAARAEPPTFDHDVTYRVPLDGAPMRGPANALVTIVEFSDFGCAYCGRAQATLAELERLYPAELRLVHRHNPLDPEEGTLAAEASLAAGAQGLFWPMHDRIFAAGGVVTRTELEGFALELGLDLARFRRDLDARRFLQAVQRDAALATRLGIRSTPMFFVNGRPIKGALPLGVFTRVIEEEIVRARTLLGRGIASQDLYGALVADGRPGAEAGTSQDTGHERVELDPARLYRVGLGLPGHTAGPDDALVTIVTFSDFECPYCARLVPVLEAVRAHHPEVRIVFRHMPLPFHPRAELAAEAAVAASVQGKFWAMHDRIFAQKDKLERADLERHARAIGLDMDEFRRALDERRYREAVASESASGTALGVRGTPTLFINGTPLGGAPSYDHLQIVYLEPKLAEARALVASGIAPSDLYATIMRMAEQRNAGSDTGVASRTGPGEERLPPGSDDHQSAIMNTCRQRNEARATALYNMLGGEHGRNKVRSYCRPYGVDLPP